jgi:GNAT superfamily N-acetyltransferase
MAESTIISRMLVRTLDSTDAEAAVNVINEAAAWYAEFLSDDLFDGKEMDIEEWLEEGKRLTWYGAFDGERMVGVMGLEYVAEVALFRHAYVQPDRQRSGVAQLLLDRLTADLRAVERVLVGTYAANHKARGILEKTGYRLVEDSAAELRRYWDIPEHRLVSSSSTSSGSERFGVASVHPDRFEASC